MRIAFAGTPDFAQRILAALLCHPDLDIVAVYTQPDRPAGRGKRLQPSPVKALALEHGIHIEQPPGLRDPEAQATLAAYRPALMVVAAYGLILPADILAIPDQGCINVHASLLPRWRGAAPVERAIEAGDRYSGVTIMQMDQGLDTGDILRQERIALSPAETGDSLRLRLAELGASCLLQALDGLRAGELTAQPQDEEGASYAAKLDRAEARINWSEDATVLARRIAAFVSANVCHAELDGQRLRLWSATAENDSAGAPGEILRADNEGILVRCGHGALRLTRVQMPGGRPLAVRELLNGRQQLFRAGRHFSCA